MKNIIQMKPEYSLTYLRIQSYKGIKNIEINLENAEGAPWFFLTGENGYGKTNILKALVCDDSDVNNTSYIDVNTPLNEGDNLVFHGHNNFKAQYKNSVIAYGANRLNMGSERSTKVYYPTISLFDEEPLLRNIEAEGLSRWYFNQKDRYGAVVALFKQIIPTLGEIEIDEKTYKVWYKEQDENGTVLPEKLSFGQLASGYQNIIAMIGDMILNLMDNNDKVNEIKDLKGIVLIDEIELYLHPKWQRRLPSLLSELFPKVLFIASTHSPIPLLGAPENSVFLKVNRTVEEGVTVERLDILEKEIKNLLPNTVLSSPIFGLETLSSIQHNKDEKFRTEDTYKEVKERDKVKQKLRDSSNTELDNMLRAFIQKKKDEK